MEDDLRRWVQSYGSFSSSGTDALNDGRKFAVFAQVRSELRAWDGLVLKSEGVHCAQVEILLETVGRRSKLSLLAPRRDGFPETFCSGPVQLTGGDSWYDPMELKPEDGVLLKDGSSWTSDDQAEFVPRRSPGMVFVLAPNADYPGLVSRMELPRGIPCAVVYHDSLANAVASYLGSVCESVPRFFHENSASDGRLLFLGVRAIRRSNNVPAVLRVLDVACEVNVVPVGGLRVGTQWAWMQGEAPRLLIEGHDGQAVYVGDNRVFALEFPGQGGGRNRAFFFLEADRGTMPVIRRNLSQTSFYQKLLAYEATWSQSIHRTRFGFHRFRVLTVTSSAERASSLVDACSQLKSGHGLFLFADRTVLEKPDDIFSHVWLTGRPGETGSL